MHGIPYRMSYNILLGNIPIRQKQPGQETAGGVRKRLERLYTAEKDSYGLQGKCIAGKWHIRLASLAKKNNENK